tara:strand:- start:116 stop:343 length:228 start_codon:yes stop_codon:yes gene_type:complete
MMNQIEFLTNSFKTLYLEDYLKLKEEAALLKEEAEEIRLAGDSVTYLKKLQQYDVYVLTAETMLDLAIKKPVAEA